MNFILIFPGYQLFLMLCKKDGKAQQKIDIIFTEYSIFITKNLSFSNRWILPQKCEGVKHQF
ncbi:hypothetical protein EMIT019CA3_300006 [Bacillus pseudomycoides]